MFQIVRNAVMVVVMLTGAAINIYFDLLNSPADWRSWQPMFPAWLSNACSSVGPTA
ncbi:hypothetical protein QA640_24045 [Bradyrhizobium sp. CB82]|uniref:hypothetical protein n=1 Tax=Bradyrhizobium sp. CB82 TaxID=3039159 RepID=UPI0024B0E9E2|nr:hypothetical protein [Bradyrhizobium sp. CB82]WFU37548.1 hypothetical protein QA640_24045 [Bradyrhizobium sp. CB82]